MLDRRLHKFYLSYKINGEIEIVWAEGINLWHAKERLRLKCPEATDIMDWTNEKPEDLEKYVRKHNERKNKSRISDPNTKDTDR